MGKIQNEPSTYTIRLELVDDPGELLRALQPISDNGGNLLSVYHERGNITPRGHIPIQVDLEATPDQYESIVDGLHDKGINVIQAGSERYSESLTVILTGHIVDNDITDTLLQIRENTNVSIAEVTISAPDGTTDISSARLRLSVEAGETNATLARIQRIAEEKDFELIEPLQSNLEHNT